MNETAKENGFIPGMAREMTGAHRPQNMDIKLLHAKKQQAEMRRNQKEEDLRENHPYFDRPLFAVPRESKFRRICQRLQNARYDYALLKVHFRYMISGSRMTQSTADCFAVKCEHCRN